MNNYQGRTRSKGKNKTCKHSYQWSTGGSSHCSRSGRGEDGTRLLLQKWQKAALQDYYSLLTLSGKSLHGLLLPGLGGWSQWTWLLWLHGLSQGALWWLIGEWGHGYQHTWGAKRGHSDSCNLGECSIFRIQWRKVKAENLEYVWIDLTEMESLDKILLTGHLHHFLCTYTQLNRFRTDKKGKF